MWPWKKRMKRNTEDTSIGGMLIAHGFITREQLRLAIEAKLAASRDKLLGEILIAQGAVTRSQLERTLGEQKVLLGTNVMLRERRSLVAAASVAAEDLQGSLRELRAVVDKIGKKEN